MYKVIKELLYITSDKILKTCVNWKLKYRDQIGKTVLTNPLPVNVKIALMIRWKANNIERKS